MTFLWILAGVSGLLACAALIICRQSAARLAQLTTMYWELKYEQGELKAQIKGPTDKASSGNVGTSPLQAFVPLADLNKRV